MREWRIMRIMWKKHSVLSSFGMWNALPRRVR